METKKIVPFYYTRPVDVSLIYEKYKDIPKTWDLLERWWEDQMDYDDTIVLDGDQVQNFTEFLNENLDDEEYEEVWKGPENLK